MSQIQITCPHCGYSKSVEEGRIPAGGINIKCPKCQESFALDPREKPVAPSVVVAESLPPEEEESLPPVTPTPSEAAGAAPSPPGKFCSTCGEKIRLQAEICPKCGVRCAAPAHALSKTALLLITFFFGGMGGHKFYQKKYLLGTLYLLFFWTFIPRVVSIVEFIIYAFKSEAELQESYPETCNGAIVAIVAVFFGIAIIGILAAIAIPQFAAYREKAFNATARSDLSSCKTEAESYFATNNAYPTAIGQLQCQASPDVALYYLSISPEEYQLISFHDQGRKAFLQESSDLEIGEKDRKEIEAEISEKFGQAFLTRAFHFVE